jgi:hypothetical protein
MLDVLNGPIMLIFCFVGSILNFYAIYVLSSAVFPRKTFTALCIYSSINFHRKDDGILSPSSQRESVIIRKENRRSRIFIYLLWLTACDSFLLVCSIFNFSMPILVNDYGSVYMKTIPFW